MSGPENGPARSHGCGGSSATPAGGQAAGAAEPLAIAVRRARASDADTIVSFTRTTWNGWDYIPLVWPSWLAAPDGVLLVATPGPPSSGSPP
jgi:hypothetical protein